MSLPTCAYPSCNKRVKRRDKIYCSRSCASHDQGRKRQESWPILYCGQCDKPYKVKPSYVKSSQFCSIECKRKADAIILSARIGQKHPRFVQKEVQCLNCGKKIMRPPSLIQNQVFCSQECRSEYLTEQLVCNWCRKHFTVQRHRIEEGIRFCSSKCYGEWLSHNNVGKNHPNWRGGWLPYYGKDWKRQRKKAKERDNYTCQFCGATTNDVGSKNIDCHHIEPYRDSKSNALTNLITLCDSCHHKAENGILPG